MARVYISSVIDAPVARVWERVRDFNGLPRWLPLVRESRIENGEPSDRVGCVRDFRLQNGDRLLPFGYAHSLAQLCRACAFGAGHG